MYDKKKLQGVPWFGAALVLTALLVALTGCGGGGGGGGGGGNQLAPLESNWDTLVWDDGAWQ